MPLAYMHWTYALSYAGLHFERRCVHEGALHLLRGPVAADVHVGLELLEGPAGAGQDHHARPAGAVAQPAHSVATVTAVTLHPPRIVVSCVPVRGYMQSDEGRPGTFG